MARCHSKRTIARNFQFLTPHPLVHPCSFTCTPCPPPTPYTPSEYVHFSKLPPPPPPTSQKSYVTLMTFRMKNQGVKTEKRIIFFCKLNIKDQCFLHSYIYNDNKNIYIYVHKKALNEKKNVYAFLIKKSIIKYYCAPHTHISIRK